MCVGANVQQGQDVVVLAWDVEQAPLVRAVAECAYGHGARFVSALYWDAYVKHSRLRHAPAETLGFVPDWWKAITTECVTRRSAVIHLHTQALPELFEDIPLERAMRDVMPITPMFWDAVDRGNLAWTVVPGYAPGSHRRSWVHLRLVVFGEVLAPIRAWTRRIPRRRGASTSPVCATVRRCCRNAGSPGCAFVGGGTDLRVGGCWPARNGCTVASETRWGRSFVFNLPTEEVFTTPDFRLTEGVVRVTRPLQLARAGRVEGLTLRFERGRIVGVEAALGAERVRAQLAVDAGAARLGEVALVDGASPVGQSGMVFGHGLIDENATSHIAWGAAYPETDARTSPKDGRLRSRWDSTALTFMRTQ